MHVADVLLSTCNGEAKWPLETGHDIAQSTHLRLIDHDRMTHVEPFSSKVSSKISKALKTR